MQSACRTAPVPYYDAQRVWRLCYRILYPACLAPTVAFGNRWPEMCCTDTQCPCFHRLAARLPVGNACVKGCRAFCTGKEFARPEACANAWMLPHCPAPYARGLSVTGDAGAALPIFLAVITAFTRGDVEHNCASVTETACGGLLPFRLAALNGNAAPVVAMKGDVRQTPIDRSRA